MKDLLSYHKIQCFVRVALFKKASDAVKTLMFSHVFSLWKIDAKSRENRTNGYLYEHRQKITFGTTFWSKKSFFLIFGFPVGPRWPPRTWREPLRIHNFSSESLDASGNQPGGLPGRLKGGPREDPGVTQESAGHHFGSIWNRRCTSQNIK